MDDYLHVYTDGACSGTPGPGGWAWAVRGHDGVEGFGSEPSTTNQRMEMTAVLEALRALNGDRILIVSDSAYVVNCFKAAWYHRWQDNGWRNAKNQPVANRELWEPMIVLAEAMHVKWEHIRGHSGDFMNEYVDKLAVAAKQRIMK